MEAAQGLLRAEVEILGSWIMGFSSSVSDSIECSGVSRASPRLSLSSRGAHYARRPLSVRLAGPPTPRLTV